MEFMKKVNEISKVVGKTATDTYNTVADKSGKVIEETKLRFAISEKQNEIEQIYVEMGKTVYDSYKTGEDVGKAFTKESKKIDKILSEIDDMNTKILLNKGLRKCPACGETVANQAGFCTNCGEKLKPVKVKEEKKAEDKKKEEPKAKVCPQCGTVCEPQTNFCSKCGYKM